MSRVDTETRSLLHMLLDRLIDGANEAEGPNDAPRDPALGEAVNALLRPPRKPVPQSVARQILSDGVHLLKTALGEDLLSDALDVRGTSPAQQREQVRRWMTAMYPLLYRPPLGGGFAALSPFELVDALSALEAGEIQPIFRANTGRNRRANRWTLARTKLQALVWKRRLLALGRGEKQANHEITVAFGEQWDTIRKWRSQCRQILGYQADYFISDAGGTRDPYVHGRRGLMGSSPPWDADEGLARAGQAYRDELAKAKALNSGTADR